MATEYISKREELSAKAKQLFEITSTAGEDLDVQKVLDAKMVPGATTTKQVVEDIQRRQKELAELEKAFAPYRDLESAKKLAAEVNRDLNLPAPAAVAMPGGAADQGRPRQVKSVGQLFIESAEYQAFHEGKAKGFSVDLPVEIGAVLFETAAGFAPESTRSGRLEYLPMRPIAVIDFIPQIPISVPADVYMEETTATEAAAERAEAAAYAEAAFVWTQRTKNVRSIGVSLPTTDEQLEDVPGMQGILDNRLVLAVQRRLDLQVLAGSGVAPNLEGTENVAGIQTQAKGTDNIADAIYKAIRAVSDDGFADAEVIFIRAAKWQDWRLAKTTDGIYLHGSPADPGLDRLWGLPVVKTNAVTSTKAITGAYRAYSALRTRTGLSVELGYVNTDFTSGKKTMRAGVRVAMSHYRPKAFAQVTGL